MQYKFIIQPFLFIMIIYLIGRSDQFLQYILVKKILVTKTFFLYDCIKRKLIFNFGYSNYM